MGNTASGSANAKYATRGDVLETFVWEVRRHITHQNKQYVAYCESDSNYYSWNTKTLDSGIDTFKLTTFSTLQKIIDKVIGTLKAMPPEQLRAWCVSNFDVLHHVWKSVEFFQDIGLTLSESDALLAAVSWKEYHMEYAVDYYQKAWCKIGSDCL
jgi:hypothetical protein